MPNSYSPAPKSGFVLVERRMLHHFQILPFLLAFGVGMAVFYFIKPEQQERVVKWPHPQNVGKITYRDRNGLCYTFKEKLVDCGSVKEGLKEYNYE